MKLFKKLKAYNEQEKQGAVFGLGCLKAMDYEKEKKGHLLLFSVNFLKVAIIKKLFITI